MRIEAQAKALQAQAQAIQSAAELEEELRQLNVDWKLLLSKREEKSRSLISAKERVKAQKSFLQEVSDVIETKAVEVFFLDGLKPSKEREFSNKERRDLYLRARKNDDEDLFAAEKDLRAREKETSMLEIDIDSIDAHLARVKARVRSINNILNFN